MSVSKYYLNERKTKNGKTSKREVRWSVNVYITANAKRMRKYGFLTKKEAKNFEAYTKTRFKKVTKGNCELYSIFQDMMNEKTKRRKKRITKTTEENYIRDFDKLFPEKGVISKHSRIMTITAERLQLLLDDETRTVKGTRLLKFLRLFFKYACDHHYVDFNLADELYISNDVKKSKKTVKHEKKLALKHNWLSEDNRIKFEERLMKMTEKKMSFQDKVQLRLALDTGLRDAETRGLQMKDIVTKDGVTMLNIHHQYTKSKEYTLTKNKKSRKVSISTNVLELLNSYIQDYKVPLYKKNGWKLKDTSPLFTKVGLVEEPITVTHTNEMLNKFFRKNEDINRITSHGLRHTFASSIYNDELMSVEDLAELMGHSSTATTYKYYIHESEDKKEKVARRLHVIQDNRDKENKEDK